MTSNSIAKKKKSNILKRSHRKVSVVIDCVRYEQLTEKWSIFPFSSQIYMIKYEMKLQPIDNQIPKNNVWEAEFPKDMRLCYFSLGILPGEKCMCLNS